MYPPSILGNAVCAWGTAHKGISGHLAPLKSKVHIFIVGPYFRPFLDMANTVKYQYYGVKTTTDMSIEKEAKRIR